MKRLIFSILLACAFLSVSAQNLSQTVSSSLKTELLNNSFSAYAAVEDTRTFYSGSTLFAAHSGSSGWFLATSNAANPRHFRTDDDTLVRAWEKFELEQFLSSQAGWNPENVEYESYGLGLNRRCTLTIGEEEFVGEQVLGSLGQEQADLECLGKAVVAYLQSL